MRTEGEMLRGVLHMRERGIGRPAGAVAVFAACLGLITSCVLWRPAPPPTLEVWSSPPNVGQGKTLVVWVRSSQPLTDIKGRMGSRNLTFYNSPSGAQTDYRAMIGIPMDKPPGEYEVEIEARGLRGHVASQTKIVRVEVTEFPEETISIPSQKSRLLTSEYLAREAKAIRAAMQASHKGQFWRGTFIPPAQGRISSPFGVHRVYNEGTASWRHRGVDIANKEGTPILAPNGGTVVLLEPMKVHGNTVILDHGQGVFSIFNHFETTLVTVGDTVETGEKIGSMGQTGLATGPHLHWGLYVAGVPVDPFEWTERAADQVPWVETAPDRM